MLRENRMSYHSKQRHSRSRKLTAPVSAMNKPVPIGRPPLLRQTNAQLLLKLLRSGGPCSKADLVRSSGLSAPTVTNVIAHFASAGIVELLGEGDSTGGRPPDILRFRAERGCVVAVEIGHSFVRLLLTDLNGSELDRAEIALPWSESSPAEVCSQVAWEVRRLTRRHGHADTQLLGLVVGVPAIVNVETGSVLELSALKDWSKVPLRAMLRKEFKCCVIVENDTNLAAQGESYRGAARGQRDFVFITIGDGVGAGIFLRGKLYRGSAWTAGEIGYLRVPSISRQNPVIQGYGRLEKVLGASGILKSWWNINRKVRTRLRVTRAADVFDLAAAGNARAKRILQQRATILADIVLDLSLILNPSLILLGGDVGNHPRLASEVNALLEGSEFAVVPVKPSALGASAVLWGGASMALKAAIAGILGVPTTSK
jgi:glucokinase